MDKTLDEMISERTGGRSGGGGGGGGGRGGARNARSRPSRGISKRRPSAPGGRSSSKVVVVGQRSRQQSSQQSHSATDSEAPTCLIGATTDVKKSAGFIASCLREGTPPIIYATSADNVNIAIKTIALTRRYLADEGLELRAAFDFPEFADNGKTAKADIHILAKRRIDDLSRVSAQLMVSKSSVTPKVAGALAASIREAPKNLKRVCISAAGPDAMIRAAKAIYMARHFLTDDELDLSVIPEFDNADDGPSVVNLFCIAHAPGAEI